MSDERRTMGPTATRETARSADVREWAVVSGASSGIGEAFAEALGRRGLAVALVARTRERLDPVAARIGTPTRCFPTDLSVPGLPDELVAFLSAPENPVALLVNCAGVARCGPLVEQRERDVIDMVQVNLGGLVALTRATLPGMVRRGRGGIINVSSSASDTAAPDAAVYAATKAAVDSFSRSLRWEVADHGIVVTCVRPGYTRTPMLEEVPDGAGRNGQRPEDVADAALRAHDSRRSTVAVPPPRVRDRLRRHVGPLRRRVPRPVMAAVERAESRRAGAGGTT